MKLPHQAHVIVADGQKYLMLVNAGDGDLIDLRVESHDETEVARTGELGVERPGRYPVSGGRRTAVEQTDWNALAKVGFAQGLADVIDDAVAQGRIGALVIMADARTLGVLRSGLSDLAQKAVLGEIVGDYAHQTVEKIERAVMSA